MDVGRLGDVLVVCVEIFAMRLGYNQEWIHTNSLFSVFPIQS